MTSHDLFSSLNELEFLGKVSDFEVAVVGKNEIFLVDAYRMQSVKYFCCDSRVLAFSCLGNEIWTQTEEKLYRFDVLEESGSANSAGVVIKNRVDTGCRTLVACNSAFVVVCNGKDLQVFKKGDGIVMKKVVQDLPLDWISWNLNGLIVVSGNIVKVYRVEEIIKSFYEEKFRIIPEVLRADMEQVEVVWVFESLLYLAKEDDIYEMDLNRKSGRFIKIKEEAKDFPLINVGEKVVARNIIVGDEIYLAIGTDIGRVIIFSIFSESKLVFFNEKSPITFIALHNNVLAASTLAQTLAFWDFSPVPGTVFNNEAVKVVEVWTSHIKLIVPLEFTNSKTCENKWKNIYLGQTETGAILLIDFESKSILSSFQALKSIIISAKLHVNLEYLQLFCENGHIYIFNMISLALERDISGDAVFNFHHIDKLAKIDRFSVLLNSLLPHHTRKPLKVSFCFFSSEYVPVLNINSIQIAKKSPNLAKELRALWSSPYLKPAFFAKTREVSYENIPSKLTNSIKIVSFYQLYEEIVYEPADFLQILLMCMLAESKFKKIIFSYSEASAEARAYIERSGNLIIKNTISGKNLPKVNTHKETLNLSEVAILALSLMSCLLLPPKPNAHFLQDLVTLLNCNDNAFSLFTCQLLISGSSSLEHYLSDESIEVLISSLLSASCAFKKSSDNEYFYQSLISVGLMSVNKFILILTSQIKLTDQGKLQHKIFFTIEHFILNHFLQATSVIEEIADFLLKSHELRSSIGSKRFSADFTTVLETVVGLLPMTASSQDSRFLLCGLPTGFVIVYDFKSNKKWKHFRVFDTTVTALDVLEGNLVAYSAQESFLKVVKMEQKIILSGGDLRIVEMIPLCEVEPETTSYQEMIKTTKVKWIDKARVLLFRENKREYVIKINNFQ